MRISDWSSDVCSSDLVDDREALRTDVESLKQTIVEVAGDDRERTVLIRADARTPWQAVITAYDALGQLGFRRIANATAPEQKPAAAEPGGWAAPNRDRKSTRLNSSHNCASRMPSYA